MATTPAERATARVLLKFRPSELADVDRMAARMGYPRAVAIKRLLAAMVQRSDEEAEAVDG